MHRVHEQGHAVIAATSKKDSSARLVRFPIRADAASFPSLAADWANMGVPRQLYIQRDIDGSG